MKYLYIIRVSYIVYTQRIDRVLGTLRIAYFIYHIGFHFVRVCFAPVTCQKTTVYTAKATVHITRGVNTDIYI